MKHVQSCARRSSYALRCDVRRYFANICHARLLELLGEVIEDEGVMWLCECLLAHTHVPDAPRAGAGLPIGNLTSQFWANVYLHPVDDALSRLTQITGWARYMDDIVVFAASKRACWEACETIYELGEHLRLAFKPSATQVVPVRDGVPWLGGRVWPSLVRLDHAIRRRLGRKLTRSQKRWQEATTTEEEEQARAQAMCEHANIADALTLRQELLW